jgi:hypothetical protein
MTRTRRFAFLASALSLITFGSPALADQPSKASAAKRLAARIDELIEARLKTEKVEAAPIADDAEFCRRVFLDLAGHIPLDSDVEAFLPSTAPDKRERLVEQLINGPSYVNHFTNVWRALLIPQAGDLQIRALIPRFNTWLSNRVRENVPYDQMVRELLTAPLSSMEAMKMRNNSPSAVAFYQANELKPENLAATTSRLFLGIKL